MRVSCSSTATYFGHFGVVCIANARCAFRCISVDHALRRILRNLKADQHSQALVESHKYHAAESIDDVIQGKGKGLNVVLHGPPGVGKTLTGESIAEYLKCPLYAVSAGELGTNSGSLERDLNRIMDITHSWGAIRRCTARVVVRLRVGAPR